MPRAEPTPVTGDLLRGWPLPEPDGAADKHDRGTVLVVGGARATPGAVLLAALGTLRAGAGRLQVATVGSTAVALGVALPEAMVQGLPEDEDGALAPHAAEQVVASCTGVAAIVLGPGLVSRHAVAGLLADVLPGLTDTRVLLDAAALRAAADAPRLLAHLAGRLVFTPNAAELAALLGHDPADEGDAAREVAERFGAVVSVRGAVAAPDGRLWKDAAGDVGLGTSGSGDVLAGVVGGLLARGAPAEQAAVWGRHAHAAAGDRLAGRAGRLGFLARELLDEVPAVLDGLRGMPDGLRGMPDGLRGTPDGLRGEPDGPGEEPDGPRGEPDGPGEEPDGPGGERERPARQDGRREREGE